MDYFYFSFLCVCMLWVCYDGVRLFFCDKGADHLLGEGLTNEMKVGLVEVQFSHQGKETLSLR